MRVRLCSAASLAWSAVHTFALKNLRGTSEYGDTRPCSGNEGEARRIILHGWTAGFSPNMCVCLGDISHVDDSRMFRSDADAWLVKVASESDSEDSEFDY